MAKIKQQVTEDVIIPKSMPIFTNVGKYKPLPRFKSGCTNC